MASFNGYERMTPAWHYMMQTDLGRVREERPEAELAEQYLRDLIKTFSPSEALAMLREIEESVTDALGGIDNNVADTFEAIMAMEELGRAVSLERQLLDMNDDFGEA